MWDFTLNKPPATTEYSVLGLWILRTTSNYEVATGNPHQPQRNNMERSVSWCVGGDHKFLAVGKNRLLQIWQNKYLKNLPTEFVTLKFYTYITRTWKSVIMFCRKLNFETPCVLVCKAFCDFFDIIWEYNACKLITVAARYKAMNWLRSLGRWDRVFQSHSGHGCLMCVCFYSVCIVTCTPLIRRVLVRMIGFINSWLHTHS
jgi:hypothetical protein